MSSPTDDRADPAGPVTLSDLSGRISHVAELHPRYKATALTDLEAAGMFAVKGVFAATRQ